jgi:hypothetical protein
MHEGLTICCLWVRGHVPFTAEYVIRLQQMAERYAPPHRFVCLTDRAQELRGIETIPIVPLRGVYAWWNKVRLFDPAMGLGKRIVYLDLDVLIVNPLHEIIEYPAPFALCPDGGNFRPKTRRVVKRFNSSVMVWDEGHAAHIASQWNPSVAADLWGDQDWIGEQCHDAAAMPRAWFPRISETASKWKSDAKVILCKKPKNAEAVKRWHWFDRVWGNGRAGVR